MQAKSTNTQLSSLEIGPLVATITQHVTNQVSRMSHSLDKVYSSTVYYYYSGTSLIRTSLNRNLANPNGNALVNFFFFFFFFLLFFFF